MAQRQYERVCYLSDMEFLELIRQGGDIYDALINGLSAEELIDQNSVLAVTWRELTRTWDLFIDAQITFERLKDAALGP